jgi:hypothetical protein
MFLIYFKFKNVIISVSKYILKAFFIQKNYLTFWPGKEEQMSVNNFYWTFINTKKLNQNIF